MSRQVPWARIGAEFLAILAGVTVALVADDWRARQGDRETEVAALEEILRDLEEDSVELASMRRRMRWQNDAALWAQANFGRDVPADSAISQLRRLMMYSLYQPIRSGYVGLRDTGGLRLVLDRDLRSQLVVYYEKGQPYMQQLERQYWPLRETFLRTAESGMITVGDTMTTELFPDGVRLQLLRPWSELSSNAEFQTRLMTFGLSASNWGVRIDEMLGQNSDLRGALEGYLR